MNHGIGKNIVLAGAMLLALSAGALAQSGPNNLVLEFQNLATLDEAVDGHYEGWAIVDGAPVSTGKFNVNGDGMPVELGGGAVIEEFDAGEDISEATDIKISIEPVGDADEIPSGLIIVDGAVESSMAILHTSVPGLDMLETMTSGAYFLATPSDNDSEPDNDNEGIWWLTMPGPEAGLQYLPDLGPNWTYEGWVVDVSGAPMPYSTGTFDMAEGFDSDAAGCMGGGPPFPGQDFVAYQCGPILDLASGDFAAVISIEPVPDNGAGPFLLKPLAGAIPTDGVGQSAISMGNQVLDTFPSGMAGVFGSTATTDASWGTVKSLY